MGRHGSYLRPDEPALVRRRHVGTQDVPLQKRVIWRSKDSECTYVRTYVCVCVLLGLGI